MKNLYLGGSAFLLTLGFTMPGLSQQDGQDSLRVAAEGYLSNREAFTMISCRYQLEVGKAGKLETAVSGRLENSATQECYWLVHGNKRRLDQTCDPASVKTHALGKGYFVTNVSESYFLDNGTIQLRYTPNIANICPPENPSPGISGTPFDLDVMGADEVANPGRQIQDCLKKGLPCRYEGTKIVDGVELAVIWLKGDNDWESRFFLDPQKGFLPMKIQYFPPGKKTPEHQVVITEARECSGGRWFPWRSVVYMDPAIGKGASYFNNVRRYVVTELDVDARPSNKDFYLELPKGTTVNDTQRGQITLEEPFRATLDNLSELLARCRLQAEAEGLRPKSAPGGGIWNFVKAGAIALVVLLAITLLVKRYRRNQAT